jgi:putative hydrolase of the HAD superfamily
MQKYEWLLFDADGTLFDYDRAEAFALRKTFQRFNFPFDENTLAIYRGINRAAWSALERGEIKPSELSAIRFRQVGDRLNLSIDPETFSPIYLQNLANSSHLMDGALELIVGLYGKFQLGLITNGLKAVQRPRLDRSGLREFISAVIISEEVGAVKPDRAIFSAAFESMGNPGKDRVLMIGDSLSSDIQGGLDYGIDTCWFNPGKLPKPDGMNIAFEISHLDQLYELLA